MRPDELRAGVVIDVPTGASLDAPLSPVRLLIIKAGTGPVQRVRGVPLDDFGSTGHPHDGPLPFWIEVEDCTVVDPAVAEREAPKHYAAAIAALDRAAV